MGTQKKSIRNERFNDLLNNRFKGVKAAMARALDIDASLVWRYSNGKGIGEDIKNLIEKKLELHKDWLDGKEIDESTKKSEDDGYIYKSIGRTKETLSIADLERVAEFLKLTPEQQNKAINNAKEEQTGQGEKSGNGDEGK